MSVTLSPITGNRVTHQLVSDVASHGCQPPWHIHLDTLSRHELIDWDRFQHYNDVIISTMAYLITGVSIVYSTVCSGVDQRKHQSSASLAFVRGIHQSLVNSPHKGLVTRKMFLFDDVIMNLDRQVFQSIFVECFHLTHLCVKYMTKPQYWKCQ